MGKDNGNTTNSWLNLGKVLELTISGGVSTITGKQLGKTDAENGCADKLEVLKNIRPLFYKNLEEYVDRMVASARRSASCGRSFSRLSMAMNASATTDRPCTRQPLPLYFVP